MSLPERLFAMPGSRRPGTDGGTPAGRREGIALAAATLAWSVVQLDVSVVNVAVRSIGTDLGAGIGGLQWTVDAYTVAFAALILTAGALGDRFGAPRVLLAGFALFTLASMACGLAPSAGLLIVFRAAQGIGAAALGSCSLALVSRTFPDPARRARALGVWSATSAAGMAAGPLVGGVLIAVAGWRAIFFINLPVGAVGAWLASRCADEVPDGASGRLDLRGQVAATAALALLAAATIEAGSLGLTFPVIAGYALAVIAAAVFIASERRSEHPMLPLSLFRQRTFSAAVAVGASQNVLFYGLIFVFSLFLQQTEHLSALGAGAAFLPLTLALMTSNAVCGRLMHARGSRAIIGAGGTIMAVSSAALWPLVSAGPVVLTAGLTVLAFGMGLTMPAMTAAVLGSADGSRAGIASGTLTAFRQSGSVLGVAVFGAFLGAGPASGLRASFLAALVLAAGIVGLSRLVSSEGAR